MLSAVSWNNRSFRFLNRLWQLMNHPLVAATSPAKNEAIPGMWISGVLIQTKKRYEKKSLVDFSQRPSSSPSLLLLLLQQQPEEMEDDLEKAHKA